MFRRCPVHGILMPQSTSWYYPVNGHAFTIIGCPRANCDQRARADTPDGPWAPWPPYTPLLQIVGPDGHTWLYEAGEEAQLQAKIEAYHRAYRPTPRPFRPEI